jgi:hypothetical protein
MERDPHELKGLPRRWDPLQRAHDRCPFIARLRHADCVEHVRVQGKAENMCSY